MTESQQHDETSARPENYRRIPLRTRLARFGIILALSVCFEYFIEHVLSRELKDELHHIQTETAIALDSFQPWKLMNLVEQEKIKRFGLNYTITNIADFGVCLNSAYNMCATNLCQKSGYLSIYRLAVIKGSACMDTCLSDLRVDCAHEDFIASLWWIGALRDLIDPLIYLYHAVKGQIEDATALWRIVIVMQVVIGLLLSTIVTERLFRLAAETYDGIQLFAFLAIICAFPFEIPLFASIFSGFAFVLMQIFNHIFGFILSLAGLAGFAFAYVSGIGYLIHKCIDIFSHDVFEKVAHKTFPNKS